MIIEAVKLIADTIIAEKNYLTQLDAKTGDGDHGLNMARGANAVLEAIDDMDDNSDISTILNMVGQEFIMNVGGASGPLYGSAFIEASKVLNKDSKLDPDTLLKFFEAATSAIKRRGHAKAGDKTMLDVLIPICECFNPDNSMGKTLREILDEALISAREGVEYTKTIVAKRGRASYIGERSIGFEDPGAVSSMIIFRSFCQFLKDNDLI